MDQPHVRGDVLDLAALERADEVPGERSRWRSCLASRSCARFSPTSSMPASARAGSSSAATYLMAARISHARRRSARGRARGSSRHPGAAVNASRVSQPRLPARDPVVAPVGEVAAPARQLVQRSRCSTRVDAGRVELLSAIPAQVEHAPVGARRRGPRRRASTSSPDLVAAGPDARADRGGGRPVEAGHGASRSARRRAPRQPQWSIATRSPSESATRQAVGHQHEQREAGLARRCGRRPRQLAAGLGRSAGAGGRVPLARCRCRAPASPWRSARRVEPRLAAPAAGGSRHVGRVVVGEDAEVERLVGALAHAALPGGEGDAGAGSSSSSHAGPRAPAAAPGAARRRGRTPRRRACA